MLNCKVEYLHTYILGNPIQCICEREYLAGDQEKCTDNFIAALFPIGKKLNNQNLPHRLSDLGLLIYRFQVSTWASTTLTPTWLRQPGWTDPRRSLRGKDEVAPGGFGPRNPDPAERRGRPAPAESPTHERGGAGTEEVLEGCRLSPSPSPRPRLGGEGSGSTSAKKSKNCPRTAEGI